MSEERADARLAASFSHVSPCLLTALLRSASTAVCRTPSMAPRKEQPRRRCVQYSLVCIRIPRRVCDVGVGVSGVFMFRTRFAGDVSFTMPDGGGRGSIAN
eukprot:7217727-Prymnesium_polylepis.1